MKRFITLLTALTLIGSMGLAPTVYACQHKAKNCHCAKKCNCSNPKHCTCNKKSPV